MPPHSDANLDPERKAAIDRTVRSALAAEYERERDALPRPAYRRAIAVAGTALAVAGTIVIVAIAIRSDDPPVPVAATSTTQQLTEPQPSTAPTETPIQVDGHTDLIEALQSRGLEVDRLPDDADGVASLAGRTDRYCVGGAPTTIVEYPTVSAREADAQGITVDGQVTITNGEDATLTVTQWSAPPRFFAHQRLIVIALGPNDATLDALTELLGPTITPDAQGGTPLGACDDES